MKANIIMMIDDDQDTLTLYQLSLKETSFSSNFFTYDNAKTAIAYLQACIEKQQPVPTYIIIDLNMPEMDGFQFLSVFEDKIYPHMPNARVITTTSSIREKDKEEALQYRSVTDFISKPISKPYLLKLFQD
jgi:CheY-like chemotaxis protein